MTPQKISNALKGIQDIRALFDNCDHNIQFRSKRKSCAYCQQTRHVFQSYFCNTYYYLLAVKGILFESLILVPGSMHFVYFQRHDLILMEKSQSFEKKLSN